MIIYFLIIEPSKISDTSIYKALIALLVFLSSIKLRGLDIAL